jgi:hypothetical protein
MDSPISTSSVLRILIDDLDNPMRARIDQNGAVVHNYEAIVPNAVFPAALRNR